MVTLKIYLRTHQKNTESGVVWVSFYVNREKVNFSTSVRCEQKDWNSERCYVKKSDKEAEDKNLIIENIAARINNVFVKYRLRDRKLTRDAFLKEYHRPSDYATFFDFVKANKAKINAGTDYLAKPTPKHVKR